MPAQETDKKLETFTDAMMTDATDESQSIINDLTSREDEMISKAKADITSQADQYKTKKISEIRARESYRVNFRMTEKKRAVLQYREDCANETYEAVKKKIIEFTKSEEYPEHLKKLLQKAVGVFGYGFSAEVELRREDMPLADELAKAATGVSLAFTEGNFELGGLRLFCGAKNMRIDMTFDESLRDIMGRFAEITGLRVDE